MLSKLERLLSNYGTFPARIRKRHRIFWKAPDAEIVRNQPLFAKDELSKWKDAELWQRKLSNKANAKEFAIKHGAKVADLYFRGRDFETLDFDKLPSHYVIRPTIGHSSGMVFIMNEGINLFDNKVYTPDEIKFAIKQACDKNPQQEFLFEEFLRDEAGEYGIPDDYKFMCFNGEIAAFGLINRLGPKKGFETYFDLNWNKLPSLNFAYPEPETLPVKPACWDEMVEQVKLLSSTYEVFVRIDFYATHKGAVFGEFTPTPGLGRGYTHFGKKRMLDYWDKHCKGMI